MMCGWYKIKNNRNGAPLCIFIFYFSGISEQGTSMNQFAERLKELRKEKDLSQNELARQLNISVACINRWEKNLRVPNIDSIILLCKYFSCSADYLIGLTD